MRNVREMLLILSGKETPGLKAATTDTQRRLQAIDKKTRQLNASNGMLGASTKRTVLSLAKYAAGALGLYIGLDQLKAGMEGCIDAAETQVRVNTRLDALMRHRNGTTQRDINLTRNYIKNQAKLTAISGKAAVMGASELASFRLRAETIRKLTPAMFDLATGMDGVKANEETLQRSGKILGRIMMGNAGSAGRFGIILTKNQQKFLKNANEGERLAFVLKLIHVKYGDLARRMANTPEGIKQRHINNIQRFRTEIGMKLLPIQEAYYRTVEKNMPQITALFEKALAMAVKLGNQGGKAAIWLSKNWATVGPVVYGVGGALVALEVAMKLYTAYTWTSTRATLVWCATQKAWAIASAIWDGNLTILAARLYAIKVAEYAAALSTKVLTGAQWAYNVALDANPIGLVCLGLAALAGIGFLVYKNWDKITRATMLSYKWMSKHKLLVTLLAPLVGPGGTLILMALWWDKIKAAAQGAWRVMKQIWSAGKTAFQYATPGGLAVAAYHKIKGRLGGGHVNAGEPYVVGERRQELFVPDRSGRILPRVPAMAGGGSFNFSPTLNFNGPADKSGVSSALSEARAQFERWYAEMKRDERRRAFD